VHIKNPEKKEKGKGISSLFALARIVGFE